MLIELAIALVTTTPSNEELRQQVICAETGFSRSAERKDKSAFIEFVDPDARFISSRVARGREEISSAWSGVFEDDGPTMRWRPQFVEVTKDGNLAISRGPYRSRRIGEDGNVIDYWGNFVSTWRRNADGEWKVVFDTSGDSAPEPSEEEIEILEGEPECPSGR